MTEFNIHCKWDRVDDQAGLNKLCFAKWYNVYLNM